MLWLHCAVAVGAVAGVTLLLLAVIVPLVPLQDFAVAFSISGVGVLAPLLLARDLLQEEPTA
jgi:hypothetical protein